MTKIILSFAQRPSDIALGALCRFDATMIYMLNFLIDTSTYFNEKKLNKKYCKNENTYICIIKLNIYNFHFEVFY